MLEIKHLEKKKKEIKHLKKYEEVNINHSSNIQR